MQFDSRENLQISGVRLSSDGQLYFRGYAKSEAGRTITDATYIIAGTNDGYTLLRKIEEEVTIIETMENNSLIAIGSFGNIYKYMSGFWTDKPFEISPAEMLSRCVLLDNVVHAVGTGQRIIKLTDSGWLPANPHHKEDEETDLYGVCASDRGTVIICGIDGYLAEVSDKVFNEISLPTDCDLNNVALTENKNIAVCGTNGLLLIGKEGQWDDYSQSSLGVDFTNVVCWRKKLYISAHDRVLCFENGGLETVAEIESLNLIALNDALWSIGLNIMHRFDGSEWEEKYIVL
jgi:hypothetical protein